jgi:CO/xanthine dehydrogenase Mo-binding subunit
MMDQLKMHSVGQSVIRKDVAAKALGQAIYTGDMRMPGMLVGKALRSEYPHAKIVSIDTSKAKKIAGVHAVITAKDLPGSNCFGLAIKDQEILASSKVRMMGDAVALVAAEDLNTAEEALLAIQVDYEELQSVFTIEDAIADYAPLVHEDVAGNILQHTMLRKGNYNDGFAKSDYIIENTYMTQRVEHMYIEPEVSLAHLDEAGVMNVYTSTQYTFRDRRQIAPALNMPFNMVRVKQMVTGGGFGGKDDITTEIQAAVLALATKRPVRVSWTRAESMGCSTKRHPMKIHVKHGCDKEGKLQAVWGEVYSDKGAYCSIGHFITKKCGLHLAGPYYVPNIHVDTYAVYTNNTICGAFRGFGILQASFAHESQMDQLAEKVGISPIEIRLKNALKVGLSTATGQVFEESVGFEQTLIAAQKYMQSTPL